MGIWTRLVEEGNFETVFYEGDIRSPGDFINTLKHPGTVAVFVLRGNRAVALAYLNGFQKNQAFGHFVFMRETHGESDQIGRDIVSYWVNQLKIEFVMGNVPSFNKRAMGFVQRIGFKPVGVVPGMINSVYRPERADAHIFYYRGENHG